MFRTNLYRISFVLILLIFSKQIVLAVDCDDFDIYEDVAAKIEEGKYTINSRPIFSTDLDAGKDYVIFLESNYDLDELELNQIDWYILDSESSQIENSNFSNSYIQPDLSFLKLGEKLIKIAGAYTCKDSSVLENKRVGFEAIISSFNVVSNIEDNISDGDGGIDSSNQTLSYALETEARETITNTYYTYSPFEFSLMANSEIDTNLIDRIKEIEWVATHSNGSQLSTRNGDLIRFNYFTEPDLYNIKAEIVFTTGQELFLDLGDLEIEESFKWELLSKSGDVVDAIEIGAKPTSYTILLTPKTNDFIGLKFFTSIRGYPNNAKKTVLKPQKRKLATGINEPIRIKLKVDSYNKLSSFNQNSTTNSFDLNLRKQIKPDYYDLFEFKIPLLKSNE